MEAMAVATYALQRVFLSTSIDDQTVDMFVDENGISLQAREKLDAGSLSLWPRALTQTQFVEHSDHPPAIVIAVKTHDATTNKDQFLAAVAEMNETNQSKLVGRESTASANTPSSARLNESRLLEDDAF